MESGQQVFEVSARDIPPLRWFSIKRVPDGTPILVAAHAADISGDGSILTFHTLSVLENEVGPNRMGSKITRAFNGWDDYEDVSDSMAVKPVGSVN